MMATPTYLGSHILKNFDLRIYPKRTKWNADSIIREIKVLALATTVPIPLEGVSLYLQAFARVRAIGGR
jgi:hypothetical protein